MYKVFFNEKPLLLTSSIDQKPSEKQPLLFIKYVDAKGIMKALKSKKVESIILFHPDQTKLLKHFHKHFPIVEAAGGLVHHENGKGAKIFFSVRCEFSR